MTLAETYGLRGFDAVQLAGACEVQALCIASGIPPLFFSLQIGCSMPQLSLKDCQ